MFDKLENIILPKKIRTFRCSVKNYEYFAYPDSLNKLFIFAKPHNNKILFITDKIFLSDKNFKTFLITLFDDKKLNVVDCYNFINDQRDITDHLSQKKINVIYGTSQYKFCDGNYNLIYVIDEQDTESLEFLKKEFSIELNETEIENMSVEINGLDNKIDKIVYDEKNIIETLEIKNEYYLKHNTRNDMILNYLKHHAPYSYIDNNNAVYSFYDFKIGKFIPLVIKLHHENLVRVDIEAVNGKVKLGLFNLNYRTEYKFNAIFYDYKSEIVSYILIKKYLKKYQASPYFNYNYVSPMDVFLIINGPSDNKLPNVLNKYNVTTMEYKENYIRENYLVSEYEIIEATIMGKLNYYSEYFLNNSFKQVMFHSDGEIFVFNFSKKGFLLEHRDIYYLIVFENSGFLLTNLATNKSKFYQDYFIYGHIRNKNLEIIRLYFNSIFDDYDREFELIKKIEVAFIKILKMVATMELTVNPCFFFNCLKHDIRYEINSNSSSIIPSTKYVDSGRSLFFCKKPGDIYKITIIKEYSKSNDNDELMIMDIKDNRIENIKLNFFNTKSFYYKFKNHVIKFSTLESNL